MVSSSDRTTRGTLVRLALLNVRSGALRRDGTFDFIRLCSAFVGVDASLVVINECKLWADHGNAGLLGAAEALSCRLGRPFVGVLGACERGPFPPAIFWDPTVLRLHRWWDQHSHPRYDDKTGVAEFGLPGTTRRFLVIPEHWHPRSAEVRLEQARRVDRYGADARLVLVLGDLNESPSSPLYPQRDWSKTSATLRAHKARLVDDRWQAITDAVDHLVGAWNDTQGRRVGGVGFHAFPDLAFASGTLAEDAFRATTNTPHDRGGGQLIDLVLTNRPDCLVPLTYHVHVPGGPPDEFPSDHRLVTATVAV
jgi:hypothetical protein